MDANRRRYATDLILNRFSRTSSVMTHRDVCAENRIGARIKAMMGSLRKKKKPDPLQPSIGKWLAKPVPSTSKPKTTKATVKSKKTLKRYNSATSDDSLPSFEKASKPKKTSSFKKYGIHVPSVDEIMAEQKQLETYKDHVEEAQSLEQPLLDMPCTPQKTQLEEEILLDCKDLSFKRIAKYFEHNSKYLSEIMQGKKYSSRHKRYHEKDGAFNNTTEKDLTYNYSTIVFTFEQIDHMMFLMREKFDPEDKKSDYFFKVLLPEFCLMVFMDCHGMNKRNANSYLANRPVL